MRSLFLRFLGGYYTGFSWCKYLIRVYYQLRIKLDQTHKQIGLAYRFIGKLPDGFAKVKPS